MDITKLSEIEIKAMIYDENVKIQTSQKNIEILLAQLKVVTEKRQSEFKVVDESKKE